MNALGLFTAYRVLQRRNENAHTCSLVLDGTLPEAHPGQFVMAWLPEIGEKPFSLSGNDPLRLTIADVGPFRMPFASCKLESASGCAGR